jgi:hypothetical protein
MLQGYRLRLGDGTVLEVDEDGLRTWREDSRATVQVAGTQEWRPLREFLVDMESAARLARALVPPEPRRTPLSSPPDVPPPGPPDDLSIGTPPLVQTLADETAVSGASSPPWRGSAETADGPPIRLKPLDAEPARRAVPWAPRDEEEVEEDVDERHDRLEGPLLQVLSTLGSLLSRCLSPLTPLVRGRTTRPAEEAPALRPASRSSLFERLEGRVGTLAARVRRLLERDRPAPSPPARERAPARPPAPAARVPLEAPAPVSELPVLRFAETREANEEEDVYEEEEETPGVLPAVWLWAKRLVAAGVLVGGGVLIGLNWNTWFPRAAEVGVTVFTEIDRQARSGERARELEQALGEATERLPHLAPGTIRLVLSTSRGGVLEPPEVFHLAIEAADRGRSALTGEEATELQARQRELLANLSPPQRRRLEEYERARATRGVFPFENPYALDLVARGARAMPEASRRRLQELLGKAVAAGLAPAASP